MREHDALLYRVSHRLVGYSETLAFGDRVISFSSQSYPGWSVFKQESSMLARALLDTGLLASVERFSFRYLNVFSEVEIGRRLSMLNLRLEVAGSAPSETGLQLRFEQQSGDFRTIVNVWPDAAAKLRVDSTSRRGLLLDVDTVYSGPLPTFFEDCPSLLEEAHVTLKSTFFSMLTNETLESLGPIYELD
jgi:uncharacterized protein (TIGR04255 family)